MINQSRARKSNLSICLVQAITNISSIELKTFNIILAIWDSSYRVLFYNFIVTFSRFRLNFFFNLIQFSLFTLTVWFNLEKRLRAPIYLNLWIFLSAPFSKQLLISNWVILLHKFSFFSLFTNFGLFHIVRMRLRSSPLLFIFLLASIYSKRR